MTCGASADVPRLMGREVHVWTASLRVAPDELRAMRATLTEAEIAKAERIVVPEKSEQAFVSRGMLRRVLSLYTGVAPADFAFTYGDDGRPALAGDTALDFNVSHSGDLLLIALTGEGVLGVDVEELRPDMDHEGVGMRFFSEAERERLARADDRCGAFFRCWTRKEALLKARGTGLMTPLGRFDVTLLPDEEPRVLATRFDPPETTEWWLADLHPAPGYIGSLCADGPPRHVRSFDVLPRA